MKKQAKIMIGILVVVVLAIGAAALFSPSLFTGNASGTFAKADKYSKSQMTEKDIKLRSELTSDTAKLNNMLRGLVVFSVFTEDLCKQIDTCVTEYQNKGMKAGDPGFQPLMLLKDYASFIRNNNQALGNTIGMLGNFATGKADESVDVEKNLREFGNYVKQVTEKDKVLEESLKGMDGFLAGNPAIQNRKEELKKLKSVRDQLVIRTLRFAGLMGDKTLGAGVLNVINASENLNLHAVNSEASINLIGLGSHQLAQEMAGAVLYSQDKLGFVYTAKENLNAKEGLNSLLQGTGGLNVLILSNGSLNVVVSAMDMQRAFAVNPLNSLMNASGNLNSLMNSMGTLNSVIQAGGTLNSLMNANAGLQVVF